MPIIAGVGFGTRQAIAYAKEAEEAGAAGLLVLPHYLVEADSEGISRHVAAICKAVKIGVIVYNRGVCRLGPDILEKLAAQCPNLIGFKDGIGDLELMVSVRRRMGDRFAYLGGLPTAEFFAAPYKAMGVPVYSSAVFNFVPKMAMDFYRAVTQRRCKDAQSPARHLLHALCGDPQQAAQAMRSASSRPVPIWSAARAGPVRTPLVELQRGGTRSTQGADRQLVRNKGPIVMKRVLLTGAERWCGRASAPDAAGPLSGFDR